MDIAAWLRGLGLEQYEPAFRANEIDEKVLPSLTSEDLSPLRTDSLPLVSKIYWPQNADDAIMDAP